VHYLDTPATVSGSTTSPFGAPVTVVAAFAKDGLPDALPHLESVLEAARHENNVEVEVLALDALARGHAQTGDLAEARRVLDAADQLMSDAQHLIDDTDRIDGNRARSFLDVADE
jgi:hypothetical protein